MTHLLADAELHISQWYLQTRFWGAVEYFSLKLCRGWLSFRAWGPTTLTRIFRIGKVK